MGDDIRAGEDSLLGLLAVTEPVKTVATGSFLWGNFAASESDFQAIVNFAKKLPQDGKVGIAAFKGFVDGTMTSSTSTNCVPAC